MRIKKLQDVKNTIAECKNVVSNKKEKLKNATRGYIFNEDIIKIILYNEYLAYYLDDLLYWYGDDCSYTVDHIKNLIANKIVKDRDRINPNFKLSETLEDEVLKDIYQALE